MSESLAPRTNVKNLEELRNWTRDFAKQLGPKEVVLISGKMGVGKTQLVRHLVETLGGKQISSPTFALHHEYPTKSGIIDHLDLYRISSNAELESLGIWDLFQKSQGLILIEWAERIDFRLIPKSWKVSQISLTLLPDQSRQVTLNP